MHESSYPENSIAVPDALAHLRRFPLDGALLLFDRDSGLNAFCEGSETAHLKQAAPRVVQFGITNSCNLACTFCSRDLIAKSEWTLEQAFTILADLAQLGVLEVAFGGGEPWTFPKFAELVCRLHDETPLAVNFTTNGLAMTAESLSAIRGKYGQLRLSLYENNNWRFKIRQLVESEARFGVNYLVTPERLPELERTVLELASLGCRDILLLSYNGLDAALHIDSTSALGLAKRVAVLANALKNDCQIKLDVCWGERMEDVPRLFKRNDCGAGRDFIVLTSDKKIQPCSFHELKIGVENASDIMEIWRNKQNELYAPALLPGCARTPGFGLERATTSAY
ncbi:MAG: radical SAM protein [Candidatus Obscuribacterales bacterium]|jgi:MoaA/NifB/PqqE/SkfB family radical SAM enzyme